MGFFQSGDHRSTNTIPAIQSFSTVNDISFWPMWTNQPADMNSATEANEQQIVQLPFTILFFDLLIDNNASNGNNDYDVRINGASALSITIPASTTGRFSTGAVAVGVEQGDLMCMRRDKTASSSGGNRLVLVCWTTS